MVQPRSTLDKLDEALSRPAASPASRAAAASTESNVDATPVLAGFAVLSTAAIGGVLLDEARKASAAQGFVKVGSPPMAPPPPPRVSAADGAAPPPPPRASAVGSAADEAGDGGKNGKNR